MTGKLDFRLETIRLVFKTKQPDKIKIKKTFLFQAANNYCKTSSPVRFRLCRVRRMALPPSKYHFTVFQRKLRTLRSKIFSSSA